MRDESSLRSFRFCIAPFSPRKLKQDSGTSIDSYQEPIQTLFQQVLSRITHDVYILTQGG